MDIETALDGAFRSVLGDRYQHHLTAVAAPVRPAVRMSKRPKVNSRQWQDQVAAKLLDGYGVEDIAVWLRCPVNAVRQEVARLRAIGRLQAWWGK